MLSLFIVILFVIGYVALMTYASKIQQEELEKFNLLLDSALKYPISPKMLSNLISVWEETKLTSSNLEFYLKEKYIERTFRVCEMNLTNLDTWNLLEIILKKISPFKIFPLYKNNFKNITLRLEVMLPEIEEAT